MGAELRVTCVKMRRNGVKAIQNHGKASSLLPSFPLFLAPLCRAQPVRLHMASLLTKASGRTVNTPECNPSLAINDVPSVSSPVERCCLTSWPFKWNYLSMIVLPQLGYGCVESRCSKIRILAKIKF